MHGTRRLVLYYVPEDHDDPEHPNAYFLGVPNPEAITTLSEIRNSFPLGSSFHFRCKTKVGNTIAWMDLVSEKQEVKPFKDECIVLKATRHRASKKEVNVRKPETSKVEKEKPSPPSFNPNSNQSINLLDGDAWFE